MPGKTRAIVATSIGNMLEWYDFTIYALLARYIAGNFFPSNDSTTRLLQTYLFFGLGFVVRPLGAVLIGNYGDRAGRKAALTLTILLMAAGTGIIAFSPTYASIGAGAPLLLLLGRLLQGFSAGGEIGGATAYLLESAEPKRRGRVASWLEASMGMANILGALAAFTVTAALTENEVLSWGWRIPFIAGLAIAPVGLYLRRTLDETEAFQAETARRVQERTTHRAVPLLEIFRDHGRSLFVSFCVAVLWAVAVYVLMIFLPTYVQRPDTFNFSARQAFGASLIGNIPFVLGCVWFGSVSDSIGRRKSLFISAALLLILGAAVVLVAQVIANPGDPDRVSMHGVHSGGKLRRRGAGGVVRDFSHRCALDRHIAGVQRRLHVVRRLCAVDPDVAHTTCLGGSIYSPAWYVMLAAAVALVAIPFLGSRDARVLPVPLPQTPGC